MGTVALPARKAVEEHKMEVARLLALPPPIYLEDDPGQQGLCAVCGKRGAFGRCPACGLLVHLACLRRSQGEVSADTCPRCSRASLEEVPDSTKRVGLGSFSYKERTIMVPSDAEPRRFDARPSCAPGLIPSGKEAKAQGFAGD